MTTDIVTVTRETAILSYLSALRASGYGDMHTIGEAMLVADNLWLALSLSAAPAPTVSVLDLPAEGKREAQIKADLASLAALSTTAAELERLKPDEKPTPPMPDEEPPQSNSNGKDKLTDRQAEFLKAIIEASASDTPVACGDIARRMNVSSGSATPVLNILEAAGYIRRVRKGKFVQLFALKNPDGTPTIRLEVKTTADGTKITQCPPRYASGYGIQPSEYSR